MALRVWLPLNGDINNYGISDLTFTNTSSSNTTNSTAGKIGNCYTNNSNTAGGLLSDKTINLGYQQSMCCWVKFNSFYSSASLTGIGGQHRYYDKAPSNMGLTAKYLSANTGKLSVNTAVGTSRTYNTYCGNTTLNSGVWYHVAYTYDGTTVSLYVNGILDGTFNIPNMVIKADYIHLFSWSSSSASDKAIHSDYKLNGSLNDFRIYDHCLSAKEVKELAKGLVLHYKLAGPGQANLLHSEKPITNTVSNVAINNDLTYDLTYASAVKDTYLFFNPIETIVGGETYTLSFNCSGITTSDNITFSYGNVASTGIFKLHNGYNVCTFTKSTSETRDFFDDQSHVTDGTHNIRLSNFKLEKGLVSTPWCPSVTDTLYSTLGYNNNIEDDCSGFGNNGTNSGITIESTSGRYSSSYKYSNNNSTTNITPCFSSGQIQSELTTSIWFKTNTLNSTAPNLISLGENNFWRFRLASATSIWAYIRVGSTQIATTLSVPSSITNSLIDDQWHFCAVSFKEGIITIYVDGVSIGTYNASSTAKYITCGSSGSTWHLAGYTSTSESFIGNLSDFRIYATALSDADILELYEVGGAVDSHYNSYAYEFIEE